MTEGAVALHPESTGDPRTLRWAAPRTALPFLGEVRSAPGLDALPEGLLEHVEAVPGALLVTLAEGRDWRREGPAVRTALVAALSHPDRWGPGADAAPADGDDLLRRTAEAAIEGPVGEIAAAHGGTIELLGARDGVVEVRLHGACRGCAASAITLHQRLDQEVRRHAPHLAAVVER